MIKNELICVEKVIGVLCVLIFVGVVLYGCSVESYHKRGLPSAKIYNIVVHKKLDPIVRLKLDDNGSCTGTVISDNYVITAAHCIIDKDDKIIVQGSEENLEVVYYNRREDIALLLGNMSHHTILPIDLYEDQLHDTPLALLCGFIGSNSKLTCKLTIRVGSNFFMAAFSQTSLPGMSGGPVLNPINNQVIGIIYGVLEDGRTIANSSASVFANAGVEVEEVTL